MNEKRSVLLIGGFDAGKSNFLFRLFLAIEQKTGLLISDGLPDDVEYLRAGGDDLLKGNFAPRTSKEVHNRSIIPIKSSQNTNLSGQLIVPDCSGEKWLEIYDKREWSNDWEELISRGTGCLLFVRAGSDKIVTPLDWISCYKQFGSAENFDATVAAEADLPGVPPDPPTRITPTQVMLIEWLQFLRTVFTDRVAGDFRPRIGVVVSAWDAVPQDEQRAGPLAYLVTTFPMFEQFLRANSSAFEFQVFGVSVAGGDLANEPGYREKFLSENPYAAGYVVHSLEGAWEKSPDHTLPIAWAIEIGNRG